MFWDWNVLLMVLALTLFLVALILVRTLLFARRTEPVEPIETIKVDQQKTAEHLAAAIRCPTVSMGETAPVSRLAFLELHRLLHETYPLVHQHLSCEIINEYSLLYTWKGRRDDLLPVVLAGHQDVVPVPESVLSEWKYPPFGGEIASGYVWGRGAIDDKHQVIAILEAVEILLSNDYTPMRTIYLAFGHDEEIGGRQGAAQIVNHLRDQGVKLAAALDEGGSLLENVLPGVRGVVAVIGVAEKGYLTFELSVDSQPGHSSTPPQHTAIGILAQALVRLENHQMPAHFTTFRRMFQSMGRSTPFALQMVFANLWLLGGIVERVMRNSPVPNAAIRTSKAITMTAGGIKDNILPPQARALVNCRLMPGDSIDAVTARIQRVIRDGRVKMEVKDGGAWEASPVSPITSSSYRILERTTRQIFGEIPVAPYLVMGATDARYYTALGDQVYRFTPFMVNATDMARMHGNNERIGQDALGKMVQFYDQLIRCWGEDGL